MDFSGNAAAETLRQTVACDAGDIPETGAGRAQKQTQRGTCGASFGSAGTDHTPLQYEEPLMAALSARWPEAENKRLPLRTLNGKSLFWFRRESNSAFFDYTRGVFAHRVALPPFWKSPRNMMSCWPASLWGRAWDLCLHRLRRFGGKALFLFRWRKALCCESG